MIWPVQRTEKVSAPTDGSGEPVPQSKLIVESIRVSFGVVSVAVSKYSPLRPVPTLGIGGRMALAWLNADSLPFVSTAVTRYVLVASKAAAVSRNVETVSRAAVSFTATLSAPRRYTL